jgi:transcription antitermination factor NusG
MGRVYKIGEVVDFVKLIDRPPPVDDGRELHWAVAQTVSKMEHIVRREIEKTNHGTFLPTYARHWKVDDRQYSKECPLIVGYVFFQTSGDDYAGIPDIHGVYRVLSNPSGAAKRVQPTEMARLIVDDGSGKHDHTMEPRYTKYYRPQPVVGRKSRRRRRPRPGRQLREKAA